MVICVCDKASNKNNSSALAKAGTKIKREKKMNGKTNHSEEDRLGYRNKEYTKKNIHGYTKILSTLAVVGIVKQLRKNPNASSVT